MHLKRQSRAIVDEVVFSRKAQNRLIEHAQFIFEQTYDIHLADNYLDKMDAYITETLKYFPKAGRPCEELAPYARKLVYQGFSIIYHIGVDQIEILTIYRENLP